MESEKTTLTIPISAQEKEAFKRVCELKDTTMSQAIRAFIRSQVRDAQGKLDL